MTLAPGHMFAHDKHVHHVGLWKRTYKPALFWGGVNNSYARNVLEHGPAMCIWGGGNVADGVDCHFDGNTVSHCVTETCDQGSFHTCGQSGNAFTNRGNVMENGLFSHIQPGPGVINPARGPSSRNFRVSFFAARTLNAADRSRVTLSPRQERLRAACQPQQEEKGGLNPTPTRFSQACLLSALP